MKPHTTSLLPHKARPSLGHGWARASLTPRGTAATALAIWVLVAAATGWGLASVRAGSPAAAPAKPAAAQRPNIILLFTDDHASHAISAYGSRINTTPHIDRLAREGVLFTNCFCTNSICGPSRAVVLTGRHSHLNGFVRNETDRFDGRQVTFPKLLQAAGYQTAIIGKWHLGSTPTGFDHWQILPGQGDYYNPVFLTEAGPIQVTGHVSELIADASLTWLDTQRDKTKPFLLMMQDKAPHRNWQPAPKHLTAFDDRDIPVPPTLFDVHDGRDGRSRAAGMATMSIAAHLNADDLKLITPARLNDQQRAAWLAAYKPKNDALAAAGLTGQALVHWKYQRYIKDYLACVAGVDDAVGRLLDYLDRSGLAENTIVVYSSDQGFYLGDRGWYDKRWMYEESLRMPLLVRWPGVTAPASRCTALVQNLDFAQTFLEVAGVAAPETMQGASLVPLLRGQTPHDWRTSVYYHYYEWPGVHDVPRHCGVRTATHKLIHFYDLDEWELYDLVGDPGERRNLAGDPAAAGVKAQLQAEMARLRAQYQVESFREPPAPSDPAAVPTTLVVKWDVATQAATPVPVATKVGKAAPKAGKAAPQDPVEANAAPAMTLTDGPTPGLRALQTDPTTAYGVPAASQLSSIDPTYKPLVVGAAVWPLASASPQTAVIVSHGNTQHGYALMLRDGRPTFAVANYGLVFWVSAPEPLKPESWTHLAGSIDKTGQLGLHVAGRCVATAPGEWVRRMPRSGLRVGAAVNVPLPTGTTSASGFAGRLADLRLYWGQPSFDGWGNALGANSR